MAKRARTQTLEEATREFVKWETGQYDHISRKSHEQSMKEWENQGYFDFIEQENSAITSVSATEQYKTPDNANTDKPDKGRKKEKKKKRKISEEKRRAYISFYHDAKKYENTNISRSIPEKKHMLIDYFPHRFTVVQPLDNYAPATLGSLFGKLLKYAKTITEETIKASQQ